MTALAVKWKGIVRYGLMLLFAVIFILPFVYCVYTSLLTKADIDKIVPLSQLTLENYIYILKKGIVLIWIRNSAIMTAGIILGNIIINSMAGYALAKIKFPARNVVFFIIIGTMMIPGQITLIPLYSMIMKLRWVNTFYALIIPFMFSGFLTFLMRQFFLSIPDELEEAARIDGLGRALTFFKIILPLSKTAFATMVIFQFAGTWNAFLWPVTLTNKVESYVLTVGLNTLKEEHFEWPNITMTGVVMITVPVIAIFLAFQKHFTQSIATMGIKG